jgi:hypothetical protein
MLNGCIGCYMVAFYSSRSLVNSLQVLYILNANCSLYSCCFYELMDQCCCLYGSWGSMLGFHIRFCKPSFGVKCEVSSVRVLVSRCLTFILWLLLYGSSVT